MMYSFMFVSLWLYCYHVVFLPFYLPLSDTLLSMFILFGYVLAQSSHQEYRSGLPGLWETDVEGMFSVRDGWSMANRCG